MTAFLVVLPQLVVTNELDCIDDDNESNPDALETCDARTMIAMEKSTRILKPTANTFLMSIVALVTIPV